VRLAVYQPDIPPNLGTLLRTGACFGVPVDVIEPCGFPFSERNFRRAALDYLPAAEIVHHRSWDAFQRERAPGRLVLLSTRGDAPYCDFRYRADDILLVGQESIGVPPEVHAAAEARVAVPLRAGMRSLNVAIAAAMVLGEALRQTAAFPPWPPPGMLPPP
jgi:tRNA (cytidine/uridine-2'-O-)-methyltransferase